MDALEARTVLLRQHDDLRRILDQVRAAADHDRAALPALLVALRAAFADHNAAEERLLEPILRLDYAWGPARVARMVEEHAGEHAALRASADPALDDAAAIASLVEQIAAHMDAEERTVLAIGVLRDDPVGQASG